jgi:hypothetical protein
VPEEVEGGEDRDSQLGATIEVDGGIPEQPCRDGRLLLVLTDLQELEGAVDDEAVPFVELDGP